MCVGIILIPHPQDLGRSFFYNDMFLWNDFHKRTKDHLGQFFHRNRVKQLIEKHESLLLKWILFSENKIAS